MVLKNFILRQKKDFEFYKFLFELVSNSYWAKTENIKKTCFVITVYTHVLVEFWKPNFYAKNSTLAYFIHK